MKKIFLFFAAVCALAACDPTHEDISNAGHITLDELKAKTTVVRNPVCDIGHYLSTLLLYCTQRKSQYFFIDAV